VQALDALRRNAAVIEACVALLPPSLMGRGNAFQLPGASRARVGRRNILREQV
jgi:hypothetical protein